MKNTWELGDSARTMTAKHNALVNEFEQYKEQFNEYLGDVPEPIENRIRLIAEQLNDQIIQNENRVNEIANKVYLNDIYANGNELILEYMKGV